MKISSLLIGVFAALVFSMNASANTIDLFTDPDGGQTVTDDSNGAEADDGENFSEVGSYTTIIGGYRDLKADAISGASNNGGGCQVADDCTVLRVLDGRLTFNNDTGVTGIGIVQWDGQDSSSDLDYTGLGGENLYTQEGCPAGGCDRFVFTVYESDQGFPFLVGIYTDDTHYTEFLLAAEAASEAGGTSYVNVLLFTFFENAEALGLCDGIGLPTGVLDVNCGADGDANLADVGALQVILNPDGSTQTVAVDLEIGGITKTGVPEPGILALLGMGFAAGGLVRARRRRQSN